MGQERPISYNTKFPQLLDFSTYMIHYKILNVINKEKNLVLALAEIKSSNGSNESNP